MLIFSSKFQYTLSSYLPFSNLTAISHPKGSWSCPLQQLPSCAFAACFAWKCFPELCSNATSLSSEYCHSLFFYYLSVTQLDSSQCFQKWNETFACAQGSSISAFLHLHPEFYFWGSFDLWDHIFQTCKEFLLLLHSALQNNAIASLSIINRSDTKVIKYIEFNQIRNRSDKHLLNNLFRINVRNSLKISLWKQLLCDTKMFLMTCTVYPNYVFHVIINIFGVCKYRFALCDKSGTLFSTAVGEQRTMQGLGGNRICSVRSYRFAALATFIHL